MPTDLPPRKPKPQSIGKSLVQIARLSLRIVMLWLARLLIWIGKTLKL
jgi:hypothetical protein